MLKVMFLAAATAAFLSACASQKTTPPADYKGAYLEFMKDEKNRGGISDQDQNWTEPQKRCFDKWYFGMFSPETQRNLDASAAGHEKFSRKSWEEMKSLYDRTFETPEGRKAVTAAKADCGIKG